MSDDKMKILVLAADPSSLQHLKLDEELRAIDLKLYGGRYRDRIELLTAMAVRRGELLDLLNRHRPHVVHFSGHGSKEGEIFLVSEDDNHVPVPAETLKALFAAFKDTVRLVFFNACHSRTEAEAIVEEIDCAVGTNTRISDRAAIAFAASFYSAIASGRSIGNAVQQGKARLLVEEIHEEDSIELLVKRGVDQYQLFLVEPESPATSTATEPEPEIETDPAGRVFLSYAPSRISETQLIAAALRDRGVPLCEEALDEDRHYMEDAITGVLRSPGTASGVLSLTPEAVDSRAVKSIELPVMIERAKRGNSFFIVAARFSDFDLGEAGVQLRSRGMPIHRISKKKAGPAEAAEIARLVLAQRIAAIHKSLPPGEPLRLELYTRTQPPFKQGTALLMDWTERFGQRLATSETWDAYLLPALRDVVRAIETKAPGRAILADGRLSLPAAIALGCGFIQPKDIKVRWSQHTVGQPDQLWSIDAPKEPSGLETKMIAFQPDASDLAVLVSVTSNVEQAFDVTRPELPPFRAIVHAWKKPFGTEAVANAGQAADAAFEIRDAVRDAREAYSRLGAIHLFMAVPAGLAMMIGQLLNVLGPVQTYDLESPNTAGRYRRAALLKPCD